MESDRRGLGGAQSHEVAICLTLANSDQDKNPEFAWLLFASLRVANCVAVVGAVGGEFTGAIQGIGCYSTRPRICLDYLETPLSLPA